MGYEYDPNKSKQNKKKHGLDFNEGQALWLDPKHIIISARTADESRFLVIGKINNRHWSEIFTIRNKKIRIISMRRARPEEVNIYEGA